MSSTAKLPRAVLAALVSLACAFVLIYVPAYLGMLRTATQLLAVRAVSVLVMLLLVRTVLAKLVAREPADLGLSFDGRTLARGAVGFAFGTFAMLLAFVIAWGSGAFVVVPSTLASPSSVAFDFGLFFFSALFEEVCMRVALLGVLRTVFPASLSVGITAAIFGLLHATNPGATTLAVGNTALAGVALGLLFLERRGAPRVPSLGACTGFHLAWNVVQSQLLGIPVSGYAPRSSWLSVEPKDLLWSGGSYGLEAGLAATLVLVGVCIVAARNAHLRADPQLREVGAVES